MWGLTEQLLAAAVDALNVANWQRANAGAKQGKQSKAPDPIPRPGSKKPNRLEPEQMKARLLELRARNDAQEV